MTVAVGAVAGTKVFIAPAGAVVPSPDQFVEIKDIANMGDLGTQFSKIVRESIGDGYTRQIKGTESAPVFSIVCNRLDSDPGQIAFKAAAANRNDFYPFKVLDTDGGYTTFLARVFGSVRNYGGVNDLKKLTGDVEVEPDSITIVAGS